MIRCDRVIVERSGRMVIDRVSLSVAAGETLAVIGRSGAGKTTLLEALATAVPVRGGDIVIDDHSVRRDPDAVRARIGYVPSHLTAWPHVRADEFLELFARSAGLAGHGLEAAMERALALAGLGGRGETPINGLPDGQAKLLLVGRAQGVLLPPEHEPRSRPHGERHPGVGTPGHGPLVPRDGRRLCRREEASGALDHLGTPAARGVTEQAGQHRLLEDPARLGRRLLAQRGQSLAVLPRRV